ncbi:hypothetical protein HYPSUDRAFT_208586 [Hypholoma sublateritium FD-334 SS-4]|uniref:Uncharacterized protein n=1 Tax=Hypholoma sublateritium (strain FD-334 SS-4) TaxID=945553 RepID=A0A0D2KIW1_HYPSF|nr:hypothetical protein HYPSUDRAFT_208586 [Hypholoma sublateritium FD-334 SS-4]
MGITVLEHLGRLGAVEMSLRRLGIDEAEDLAYAPSPSTSEDGEAEGTSPRKFKKKKGSKLKPHKSQINVAAAAEEHACGAVSAPPAATASLGVMHAAEPEPHHSASKVNFVDSLHAPASEIQGNEAFLADISSIAQHQLIFTCIRSASAHIAPLLSELKRHAHSYPKDHELSTLPAKCHAAYPNTLKTLL